MPQDKPKYFKKLKLKKNCTKILKNVKRFKIFVITYMLYAIIDWFSSIYHHDSTALVTQ
jgi:hypothetical protein